MKEGYKKILLKLSAIDFYTMAYSILGIFVPVDSVPPAILKGPCTKEEEEFFSGRGNKKRQEILG